MSKISSTLIPLWSAEEVCMYPYNPAFYMLSIKNIFKILPKHNQFAFNSESFALNWKTVTSIIV